MVVSILVSRCMRMCNYKQVQANTGSSAHVVCPYLIVDVIAICPASHSCASLCLPKSLPLAAASPVREPQTAGSRINIK